MVEDTYKQRAREVRDTAANADPFIKRPLFGLADRYDDDKRKTLVTPLPSAPTAAANASGNREDIPD